MKVKKEIKHTIEFYRCGKCQYEWVSRVKHPKECPQCKSRNWNGWRLK